jgi:sec-independent protein translocase protein TatC
MFLGGVAFSYFVLLPPAIRFLFSFGSNIATPQIRIGSYIDVVTRLMFITGCIFELPVATTFLAKLGVVTSEWLAGKRKWAIILAFVLGAIITPTVDPLNQTLIAAPLIVLYEMSIWLAKLVQSKTGQKSFSYSSLNIK